MDDPELPVTVCFLQSAAIDDLTALYKDAGWWDEKCERHPRFVTRVVEKSALFVGAFYEKKMVGMGRALSDLVSDAYIQDVTVLKQYRGRGIGKKMIETLITGLKGHGVDWIGLIGEPYTRRFYENLGFRELTGHIPYRLKD
jgi:aralkylamine N-acetyltransferase